MKTDIAAYLAHLRSLPVISMEERPSKTRSVAVSLLRMLNEDTEETFKLLWDNFNSRCAEPWTKEGLQKAIALAYRWLVLTMERQSHIITPGNVVASDAPQFTRLLTCDQLMGSSLDPKFLISGILVEGQPCVIAGRSKTLKTTIAEDFAVSLGSGTPFLGKFHAEQKRVAFWTGESGASTTCDTACRISIARDVEFTDCDILWSFNLPKLGQVSHLQALAQVIYDNRIEVAIIDPLYLSLLDARTANSASNVYAMGAALQPLSEIGQHTGCTIVVLHHFKKTRQDGDENEPASLEMMSQAGITEWARQWILLQRRSPYAADGRHELWMRCGGSAGHASFWAVDIDEGILIPETLGGRQWSVAVRAVADATAESKRETEQRKTERAEERDEEDRRKMITAIRNAPQAETKKVLRELTGLNHERAGKALTTLLGEGLIRIVEVTRSRQPRDAYEAVAI